MEKEGLRWANNNQLKAFVCARTQKKHLQKLCKCLILNVDQPDLNLGSPDYESFCRVFHEITYYVNILIVST